MLKSFAIALGVLGFYAALALLGSLAYGQSRSVTLNATNGRINRVELTPLADGGCCMATVCGTITDSDGDERSDCTAAVVIPNGTTRTAAVTLATKGREHWLSTQQRLGDGGL